MQEKGVEGVPLDPVQEQYERWVYPARVYDLVALPLKEPGWHYEDLRSLFWLFWPAAPYREDMDILVAGCGSMSAAAQAYLYPKVRVVGLDFSRTALEHEDLLRKKYNLLNLTLRHARVEDVAAQSETFDFIICYGVLNHLADAAAGLRALGQVLRPDGVIDILALGKHGRLGVTLLQEMFRLMRVAPDPAGLQVVKDTLKALPPTHPVQNYPRSAQHELTTDEGLVHTFLNRRDRPFSCMDCLDTVAEAGLVFQGWKESGLYHPDLRLSHLDPLWPHLQKLGQREVWQALEMLDAALGGHWFHVCRSDRDPATYVVQFDDDAFLGYIPVSRVTQMSQADQLRRQQAFIARPPFPAMYMEEPQAAIYWQINGARTVAECLAAAGLAESPATTAIARTFFSALWRAGYAIFRLPGAGLKAPPG